ncbi:MAG: hypothetical protein QME96_02285 [Myxococcota bacterium]|nr:hypothetical protein [Myxococcota bacterium]
MLLGIAQALPTCLEILVDGHRTRANIRTAVGAISASHYLRSRSFDELVEILDRWGHEMSPDVRDAYFMRMLDLYYPGHYYLPWERLLPGR